MLLAVRHARIAYGPTVAVDDVSIDVGPGEVVALLGRNGAGKTSLALAISRLVPLAAGQISFDGVDLRNLPAYQVARLGLLHVPEGRGVLRDLTVRENLELGALAANNRSQRGVEAFDRIFVLFPKLKERLAQNAGSLSGGEQQMLVLARALLGNPRLLILDEPSLGLAPQVVKQLFTIFGDLAREGMAVLLIEQNLALSFQVASRAYVLSDGIIAVSGSTEELRNDARLHAAYLGGDVAETST